MGDDAVGDDVIIGGHLVRGGSPIVRDTVTARLTNNVDQVGDFDDAWETSSVNASWSSQSALIHVLTKYSLSKYSQYSNYILVSAWIASWRSQLPYFVKEHYLITAQKSQSANSRRVKRIYGYRYGRVFSAQDLIGLDQGNALTRSRTISPWLVLKNFRLIVVVDRNVVNKLNIA